MGLKKGTLGVPVERIPEDVVLTKLSPEVTKIILLNTKLTFC